MTRSAFAALAVSALCLALVSAPAAAADNAMARTITVNGEGVVSATPDSARVTAGVISQAATAAAALTANNTAMARVMESLRGAGIPPQNIQTSNFSVEPQYPPFRPENPEPRRITGYQVSNQVSVLVEDLTRIGTTLDALVRSGANQLGGIQFQFKNPKPLQERARQAAVADARAKAGTLATAAGVTLGPVLSIQEGAVNFPMPRMMAFEAAQARDVAISPGQSDVTVNVSITYGIQ